MSGKRKAQATEEAELQAEFSGYRGVDEDYCHAGRAALERFYDWKFGIRIHWGLYAITGNGPESWPLRSLDKTHESRGQAQPTFRAQYEELYKWWNPSRFDANEWCDLFVRAGLKFFSFTTKHHDGFSLFDTQTRVRKRRVHIGAEVGKIADCNLAYSIMETPCGRDLTGELVAAGRQRDLGLGLYFSHIDWFDSDFRIDEWNYQRDTAYTREADPQGFARMIARHRQQLRELCTNYGPIDLLSLDMWFPDNGKSLGIWGDLVETVKQIRKLQPNLMIRHRGIGPYGDYLTPERYVPGTGGAAADGCDAKGRADAKPWKVIFPGSRHFSHVWADEYKPASWIIHTLLDVAAKGGVFQVGYGPGPDGQWDQQIVSRLEEVGRWLTVNGEAVYATRPYRVAAEGENVRYTQSKDGRTVYASLLARPEPPYLPRALRLAEVKVRPGSEIKILGLDHSFRYTQDVAGLTIELPEWLNELGRAPAGPAWCFKLERSEA